MKTVSIPLLLITAMVLVLTIQTPASSDTEGQSLALKLDALQTTYLRYTLQSEQIRANKESLEEYFLLLEDIKRLEKEIEDLEAALTASSAPLDLNLPEFEIYAFMDQAGGEPIGPYASNGEVLAFLAEVEHPAFDGEGRPSEVFWQLYDGNNQPVAGVAKTYKALAAGTVKPYTFRFRLENLPPGPYRVAATHYLLENPEVRVQASTPFKVFDAASIQGIVVTDQPGGKTHTNYITNDKLPHIYLYYQLAQGVATADAAITVTDAKTGEIITAMQATRPAEKPYFGIRLEPQTFKKEQRFKVEASVTTPDRHTQTAISTFTVGYYRLDLTMPGYLKSGETARFSIQVPKEFEPPLTVELNPVRALVLHHDRNALSGTVTGVGQAVDVRAELGIVVRDAQKKMAQNTFLVSVGARPEAAPSQGSTTATGTPGQGNQGSFRDDPEFQEILQKCVQECRSTARYTDNLPKMVNGQVVTHAYQASDPRYDWCNEPAQYLKKTDSGYWKCKKMKAFLENRQ